VKTKGSREKEKGKKGTQQKNESRKKRSKTEPANRDRRGTPALPLTAPGVRPKHSHTDSRAPWKLALPVGEAAILYTEKGLVLIPPSLARPFALAVRAYHEDRRRGCDAITAGCRSYEQLGEAFSREYHYVIELDSLRHFISRLRTLVARTLGVGRDAVIAAPHGYGVRVVRYIKLINGTASRGAR
jgi:hypothetical protein